MATKDRRKGQHPKVLIDWGSVERKVKGKKIKVKAYTKVRKDTADILGLKPAKDAGYKPVKDAAGRLRLSGVRTGTSGRFLLASVGQTKKKKDGTSELVYYRVAIPQGISYTKASQILSKGKVTVIKSPTGGDAKAVGKKTGAK